MAGEGFGLDLPAGWEVIVIDAAALQKAVQDDGFDDGLKSQVQLLAGRGGKLFAYDAERRTTNVNVLKIPATPGLDNAGLAAGLPDQLAQLGLTGVRVEMVEIGAGPAVKATGSQKVADGKVDLLQIQYYVIKDGTTYVCTMATDDPGRDQATLEGIGQSFRLSV